MSHFMFGQFDSDDFLEQTQDRAKKELQNMNLNVFFNQELDFCNDIKKMISENGAGICFRFCITSIEQEFNSDDAIFPYEKYSDSELFPNGDDRTAFNEICESNIRVLKQALEKIIEIMQMKNIRLFVVDGYDNSFTTLCCSLDNMFDDILKQVKTSFSLKSTIYEIE